MLFCFGVKRLCAIVGICSVFTLSGVFLSAQENESAETAASTNESDWSRIELVDGSEVRGRILAERGQNLFVDLGFTLLSIPRSEVKQIVEAVRDTMTGTQQIERSQKGLFHELSTAPSEQSVRTLVSEVGEAVVLVKTPVGLGSGFIIHPDGYVVTNHHVVAGEHRISVTEFEQEPGDRSGLRRNEFENVRIVALSPFLDLALLKIEGVDRRFKTVPLGESVELKQGQKVFAIGNPLGLERSVSEGIISLRNRAVGGRLFIQTTTEINPGNSGGPLLNLSGEVVGVNNMKIAAFGTEGLAFAIPVEDLKWFLKNRDAFAFDPRNPNSGYRYNIPPTSFVQESEKENHAQ